MTEEQKNFIDMIGSAAVAHYGTFGILPSLTIAQAILESGWGKSALARECFNYFGMKWTKNCGCEYKQYDTKEQKSSGEYVTVKAKFRKYGSISEGIEGYYKFLSGYKRYSNLKGVTDAEKACDLIKEDGWATSLNYATNLKNLISSYGLREWDPKGSKFLGMVSSVNSPVSPFELGDYVVTASSLRVRCGAGVGYAQKRYSQLTTNARKQNPMFQATSLAFYRKGVTFTAKEIIKISDVEYWAKTPSGYVALMYGGKVYVRKK